MSVQKPHKLQKSKRKQPSTILKRPLSSITLSLARFKKRRPSSSRTKARSPVITAALRNISDPGQNRVPTGVFIEIKEYSPALEISIRPITATNPETKYTSRWSSRTTVTSSLPSVINMETDMYIPREFLQPISSLSSDLSSDEELQGRNIDFPTKLPELQRMNMQDNFIKSLIIKLTRERRETKLVLRGSKRHRCLATVKRVMDSGWIIQSQVLDKLKRGRKRKLDEQST
ncbi:hypothetical protein BOTCAL_0040g00060 [Botryotinia calthae]|uniref:Uncharacterized protein n=1 Tax=Botryotinia calthae TaxID=38488 RepID=A0A4Y8DC13_9HELO|nr:hypothetical protein BOTCAL_0040g00060 [Botryotinia calthae]